MIEMSRRRLIQWTALGLSGGGLASAFAQRTLARPLNLMVPYPAGGPSDAIARIVERPLSRAAGQPVLVENLGGVSGALGAQKVLAAPADGQFLYQGSPNELILAPLALSAVKYRPEDFRPVQMIGSFPIAILARKGLAAGSVDELVALAKRQAAAGKPLTYGSVGVGSFYHVLGAHFARTIGAEMTHVPYRGGAPMLQDMGGDLVDVALFVASSQTVGLAEQGRLKFIASLAPSGRPEAEFLRKLPALAETKGFADFIFNIWTGYFVRRDTADGTVRMLHQMVTETLSDGALRAQLEQIGGTLPPVRSLAEVEQEYTAQTARFRAIAKSIRLEAQ